MRYRFLKYRKDEYRHLFQKQRSKCVSLLRKGKKKYFSSLIINKVVDNKSFWKIVQPFPSNKLSLFEKRDTLIDDDELITEEQKVANSFNYFFSSIVTSLNLPESQTFDPLQII